MTENLIREYGNLPIVFSGGVMSNQIIKNELIGKGDFRFAEPAFLLIMLQELPFWPL